MFILAIIVSSCDSFVDVDTPDNQLSGNEVYENSATVNAALADIYAKFRDSGITSGGSSGVSYLMGLYADELKLYNNSQIEIQSFYQNNLLASNTFVFNFWENSYNLIYAANAIIEGVQNSQTLTNAEKEQFLGEAYFLRGFIHFHLLNLFGDIPYIETTDYSINSQIGKLDETLVYAKILEDVTQSKSMLPAEINGNSTRPNKWVASALLARIYLYKYDWASALGESMDIINYAPYTLNVDINKVFLNSSTETLWQLDTGNAGANTVEALTYIFESGPPPDTALTSNLINSFENGDIRLNNWVGSVIDGQNTWYYPYKYKLNTNTGSSQENSILIRLAEIYLIASEANAQLGDLLSAQNYLNSIRIRANLPAVNNGSSSEILNAIYLERRIELFTEQAHRWYDLKRTNRADAQLGIIKPNWNANDILLPIPESELILNPNLRPQNAGY